MDDTAVGQAMANMRERYAPEPHAEGAKATKCYSCGEEFWQWCRQYKDTCAACGAARQAESQRSMRNREGYMYERWLLKQHYKILAEMRRLGMISEEMPATS